MTNQEAITKLTNIMHDDHYAWHPSILTAFSMAVDALRGLPSAQPTQTNTSNALNALDCVSRQAAIRWVKTECNPYGKPTLEFESGKRVIEHLKQMPSAQPEPCEDFVKVVRCEKCRYVHCDKEFDNYWCNRMSGAFMVEAEGFCKWGR